jgi:enamine deaminase RidA (YjgF/YER057c/UK114 family)
LTPASTAYDWERDYAWQHRGVNRSLPGEGLAPPAAHYALAVLSEAPRRLVHTAGIVPVTPDGTVPADLADQAHVVWTSILLLLTEADMTPADIVSVTTYVIADRIDELATVMAVRDLYLGDHRAASTLVTVPRLARPEWLMEVAVVAAA